MSKHRKHRKEPVTASSPVQADAVASVLEASPRPRRMVWQLAGVLGASVVLGFAFNASSPVGVRFRETKPVSLSTATAATNQPAPAPAPAVVAAVTNRVVVRPPSPPPPIQQQLARHSTNTPPPVTPAPAPAVTTAALSSPQLPLAKSLAPTPFAPPPAPVTVAASNPPPAAPNPAPIHWAEAKQLVEAHEGVLVDVRHKSMYDAGHIPGAISLPETSTPDEFTAFLNQHPTNLTLIVYCSSVSCSQSARVANRFVSQYQRPNVKYMTGGYMEYQQAELAKNPAQPTP